MGILVGMDEAGYGPNLGPLVVAATAWQQLRIADCGLRNQDAIPLSASRFPLSDLYEVLHDAIVRQACTDDRISIADSKTLYHPGGGLRQLERGVHAALLAARQPAARWSSLVESLAADPGGQRHRLPWHDGVDCRLPIDAAADEVTSLGTRLADVCGTLGVRPVALRARLVFPAEFNELTDRFGSKGASLSHVTIGLLRDILSARSLAAPDPQARTSGLPPQTSDPRPPTSTYVVCDKHGGRNHYHALLQHFFPDRWIETLFESRAESRYHWGSAGARIDIAFRTGGEAFLPAALASMTAKYVRELAMQAFNQFWCARVPDLRPTAGYPADARRFKAEIESVQRELQIDDHTLWRNR